MSHSDSKQTAEVARFHALIANGSVADLQQALADVAPVNGSGPSGQNALMAAINAKDIRKVQLLIDHGADPELTDDFNRTALNHATCADFVPGVQLLLGLGVDRGYEPKYPLKKTKYEIPMDSISMPSQMQGVLTEAEWEQSLQELQANMQAMNENPSLLPVITEVESVEVLKLFLQAGDDLSQAPVEVRRKLLGLEDNGRFQTRPDEFDQQRLPVFGTSNPEPMNFPFWRDMIRRGCSAYAARRHFEDSAATARTGAIWCYDRFGSSLTQLADGRYVQIGGEHEDFYDPDFHIYNDVVVHDGQGDFQIYGYPHEIFQPTDFHAAVLVEESIYIIGCLGYVQQRVEGQTPVYRLRIDCWQMESVETTGTPPGWIHGHRARFDPASNSITIRGGKVHRVADHGDTQLVTNPMQFTLDLASLQWNSGEP